MQAAHANIVGDIDNVKYIFTFQFSLFDAFQIQVLCKN